MIKRTSFKLVLLALSLMLFASGCFINASGEYYAERPSGSGSAVQIPGAISDFEGLRNTLFNIVRSGVTSDKLTISDYEGDLGEDLLKISTEVQTMLPIGVYSGASIAYKETPILSYHEVQVTVSYNKTQEQMDSVVEVVSRLDLERNIGQLFSGFLKHKVLYLPGIVTTDSELEQAIMKVWFNQPQYAVELKKVSITSHPADQPERIIEIAIEHNEADWRLREEAGQIAQKAKEAAELCEAETEEQKVSFIFQYLNEQVEYDEEAMRVVSETAGTQPKTPGYTAYGALVDNTAAQSGFVLAAKALADELDLNSTVVSGFKGEQIYCWLYLSVDEQWMHFDVTAAFDLGSGDGAAGGEQGLDAGGYLLDTAEAAKTFRWSEEVYGIFANEGVEDVLHSGIQ